MCLRLRKIFCCGTNQKRKEKNAQIAELRKEGSDIEADLLKVIYKLHNLIRRELELTQRENSD